MNNYPIFRINSLLHYFYNVLEPFRFTSRINRSKYGLLFLFWMIIISSANTIWGFDFYLTGAFYILGAINICMLGKRRLNDVNFSGLWLLIIFLFIWFVSTLIYSEMAKISFAVGKYFFFFLFWLGIFPGKKESNKYGQVPKPVSKFCYIILFPFWFSMIVMALKKLSNPFNI